MRWRRRWRWWAHRDGGVCWQTCRDGSDGGSGRVEVVGRMEMVKYGGASGSGGMYLEKRFHLGA